MPGLGGPPRKVPRAFDGFDFGRVRGRDAEASGGVAPAHAGVRDHADRRALGRPRGLDHERLARVGEVLDHLDVRVALRVGGGRLAYRVAPPRVVRHDRGVPERRIGPLPHGLGQVGRGGRDEGAGVHASAHYQGGDGDGDDGRDGEGGAQPALPRGPGRPGEGA